MVLATKFAERSFLSPQTLQKVAGAKRMPIFNDS